MKKRILSLALTLVLLCTLLPAAAMTARAAVFSGTFGAEGDNLEWSLDTETGVLIITGSGAMAEYISVPWEKYREKIKSVLLPDGLTSIANSAFSNTKIEEIGIPDTVETIGSNAFWCSLLNQIEIPGSVRLLGSGAFGGTPLYNNASWEDDLLYIDHWLIECRDKEKESVSIREDTRGIAGNAFEDCAYFSSITFPEQVVSIGPGAFCGCAGLTELTVPGNVTDIGSGAFRGTSLRSAAIDCARIGDSCFAGLKTLKTLTLGEHVEQIGDHAFEACTALEGLSLPDSVKEIGQWAFSACIGLKTLTLGNGVARIKDDAFSLYEVGKGVNNELITELVIPEQVQYIGWDAFFGFRNLKNVTVYSRNASPRGAGVYGKKMEGYNARTEEYVEGFAVTGYRNSEAESYARGHYFTFIPLDPDIEEMFSDVSRDAYYAEPVAWAVANGITNGTSATTFGPDKTCTRGQVVTFLWRAKGSPEPTSTENPFTDVSENDYYYKAVLWAKETGVTSGTSATKFSPGKGCTRGQVVTFLWRAEGEPEPTSAENPFTDVPAGQYYTKAVLWAVENKITNGTGATTFSPDKTCTRGQIVTFLYRDLG